ncbi:uncharacterized protein MKK02DRAFT_38071 [Dioszegia hungarica]|uniref:Uncharacterized protein n=1 Tax=Dioszegia hungarica TaxID=4972 RepID=A0AA38LRM0_9TREE|nr:uncharacterized protein MKK02DRAFT_38071 [Dioszegia hungarica]KAI9634542.1 hypothetical protein MKK02DRAFT_38071 [Dioszegia hungarica]
MSDVPSTLVRDDGFRHKIDSHFAGSPHKQSRAEFMLVTGATPIEKKGHFTREVVGAAAAMEAMKAFEKHEIHTGSKPTHHRAKEIIAGLASGYASRMVEEKGLPFSSTSEKTRFIADAQREAIRDSKRALRESGLYEERELEKIDKDEMHGHLI